MKFTSRRRWFLLAFLSILSALLDTTRAPAQSNLVLLVSQPGDYIGQGKTYSVGDDQDFSFSGDLNRINVWAFGFTISLGAPLGEALKVGTYGNTWRWPFSGEPALEIAGNGRGCNSECGVYGIPEIETNAAGAVDRF